MNERRELIIRPYEGVGPVDFGMTRQEVRQAVGSTVETFYRTQESILPTDAFDAVHMHVHYRPPDVCDLVYVFPPALVLFQGERLLNRPYAEIRAFFLEIDPDIELDGDGFTSHKFGTGIYSSLADYAPQEPVEGVAVFERGYYDRK
jgi:hypothetical protein